MTLKETTQRMLEALAGSELCVTLTDGSKIFGHLYHCGPEQTIWIATGPDKLHQVAWYNVTDWRTYLTHPERREYVNRL